MATKPIPECHFVEAGLDKGFQKFFNFKTVRGRVRCYLITVPCQFLIYKTAVWLLGRKEKKQKSIKAAEDDAALSKAVKRWLDNGKKFDY